ncbi:MAG: hypothetical protein IPO88_32345 [Nannocystis sp.]|uniref:hypothetical protein n=1 Tax=Nannocystis sp. TaxID=1962667 RepID=UPI002425A5D4|nr:hypothetical protein [Nannocystis sp.]MBK9758126.1 hypothetical protein [Nannocystis sp.]
MKPSQEWQSSPTRHVPLDRRIFLAFIVLFVVHQVPEGFGSGLGSEAAFIGMMRASAPPSPGSWTVVLGARGFDAYAEMRRTPGLVRNLGVTLAMVRYT